ncbi:MAG: FGGY-family carbohydrate kinase, partial [Boseongicola sp.]|nr:FGGY-family carbohydrate kinase [Boseongicola sp.]
RTAVVDERGEVLSLARSTHLPQDQDRIDAARWWQAVEACMLLQVSALKESGRRGTEISRIAVDGTSGSMVLCDAGLRPVGRALMYDSGGFETESAQIDMHAPKSHIARGPNSALARAMRLVEEDTDGLARHLLHQADFIAARLTGRGGHSDHNNALKTGLDPATGTWPDWIGNVIDTALLPLAHAAGTPVSEIEPDFANRIGLASSAVVCAGTTDSIAAFLAAAPPKTGTAVTSLGSTLAIKVLSRKRIDDPEIGLYSHRLGDAWLVGGASNSGGAVLAHFFSSEDIDQLSARIDVTTPSGLDYYPLIHAGERFPVNDPNLAPRVAPRPADDAIFLQGLLEGIARIEAQCYSEIEARGGRFPDAIYSAGGGARNPAFTEIRAMTLGIVPTRAESVEAAIGAARIAAGMSRNPGNSVPNSWTCHDPGSTHFLMLADDSPFNGR